MMKKILLLALPVVIISCGQKSGGKAMSKYEAEVYEETFANVKSLESRLAGISYASLKEVQEYIQDVNRLEYQNDTTGMSASDRESCEKLERRINIFKRDADEATSRRLKTLLVPVTQNDDCLLEKIAAFPVYLEKGDVLYYNVGLQKQGTVKLYNTDARQLLKTYAQRAKVADSLVVANRGIYLLEITPAGTQYASINITYRMADHAHAVKQVFTEEVEAKAGDFRATANKGVVLKAAFEQPRKFTLSSQFKSTWTTAAKSVAVVSVPLPAGTTDIL